MEKKRLSHLEEVNLKLEQRLEELENSIRLSDSKLFDSERERDRERRKRKKEEKTINSKIADLESDNNQLRELGLGAEERLRDIQSDISQKMIEISELGKELNSLTLKLTELELKNKSLTDQIRNLEESVQNAELRELSVSVDRSALRKEVQELQFQLSDSKSNYELKLAEMQRLLSEAEAAVGKETSRLMLEKEQEIQRMHQDIESANRTVEELKRAHKEVVTELEGRIGYLENSLAEVTEKHRSEVESMLGEIQNAAERDKASRDEKLAIKLKLAESLSQLDEVTKSRDSAERTRTHLSEILDHHKSEWKLAVEQLEAEAASISTDMELKLDTVYARLSRCEAKSKLLSIDKETMATLTRQVDHFRKQTEGLAEISIQNDQLQKELESVWQELESLKAEKDRENETHFDQITDFKDNIESLEEKLQAVSLQAELERSELEESIKGYEEHEKLLVAEYQMRISQLQTKFEQEIADRSLDDENYVAEIERLMFQLSESKEEMHLIRDDSLQQIKTLREKELAAVSSMNEFKKSKEVEITRLRSTLLDHESRMRSLSSTNEANKLEILHLTREVDGVSSELKSARKARQLLEMQLGSNRKELEGAKQLQARTRANLEERVRELEINLRETEEGKERSLSELESRFSLQVRDLKTEIENRQAEVRALKMRLIEFDSVRAGEELNVEWKSHIQELNSQIIELERQLRSRDAILEQVRKERREAQEFKRSIAQLSEEKEALLCIIEKISYLAVAD